MNISQKIVGQIWFYRLHKELHSSNQKECIPVAIALTTGIPISHFTGRYWHEFITSEVNGRYVVIPKILYRNQLHVLPWIVVELIKRVKQSNNLPSDEKILPDFDWDTYIYRRFINRYFSKKDLSDFDIDFSRYPQILFGKQILIKNGYTNGVCKFLKNMFGFRLNKELENFLLIEDLSKCQLILLSIDLCCPNELFVFNDKGFSTNRDYSNFLAFNEYLTQYSRKSKYSRSKDLFSRSIKAKHYHSIYILIVVCLYNGLRPAFLKDLCWKDFVEINNEDQTLKIHSQFRYRGKTIIVPDICTHDINILCPICSHPFSYLELNTFRPYLKKNIQNYIATNPKVFISAKGGDIQLQSLKRDIQKILKNLDFDFWNQVTTLSFQRMWGRRILEINGDHKPTIRQLKEHFNLKSKRELFHFLDVFKSKNETSTFKGKIRETYSDYINYSMEFYINRFRKKK